MRGESFRIEDNSGKNIDAGFNEIQKDISNLEFRIKIEKNKGKKANLEFDLRKKQEEADSLRKEIVLPNAAGNIGKDIGDKAKDEITWGKKKRRTKINATPAIIDKIQDTNIKTEDDVDINKLDFLELRHKREMLQYKIDNLTGEIRDNPHSKGTEEKKLTLSDYKEKEKQIKKRLSEIEPKIVNDSDMRQFSTKEVDTKEKIVDDKEKITLAEKNIAEIFQAGNKEVEKENPMEDKDAKIAELEAEKENMKAETKSEKEKVEILEAKLANIKNGLKEEIAELSKEDEGKLKKFIKNPKVKLAIGIGLIGATAIATGGGSLVGSGAIFGLHLPYGWGISALGGYSNFTTALIGSGFVSNAFSSKLKEGFLQNMKDILNMAKNEKESVLSESPAEPPAKKEGFWSTREDLKKLIKEKGNWGALKKVLFSRKEENLKEKIERIKKENKVAEKPVESVSQPATNRSVKSIIDIESRIKVAEPSIIDVEDNKIKIISPSVEAEDEEKETDIKDKDNKEYTITAKDIERIEAKLKLEGEIKNTNELSPNSEAVISSGVNEMEKLIVSFKKGEVGGKELLEYVQVIEGVRKKYGNEKAKPLIDAIKNKTYSFDKKTRGQIVDAMIEYAQEHNMRPSEVRDYVRYFEFFDHVGKAETYRWLIGRKEKENEAIKSTRKILKAQKIKKQE